MCWFRLGAGKNYELLGTWLLLVEDMVHSLLVERLLEPRVGRPSSCEVRRIPTEGKGRPKLLYEQANKEV